MLTLYQLVFGRPNSTLEKNSQFIHKLLSVKPLYKNEDLHLDSGKEKKNTFSDKSYEFSQLLEVNPLGIFSTCFRPKEIFSNKTFMNLVIVKQQQQHTHRHTHT